MGRRKRGALCTATDDLIITAGMNAIAYGGAGDDTLVAEGDGTVWHHLKGQEGDDRYVLSTDHCKVALSAEAEVADGGYDIVDFGDLLHEDVVFSTGQTGGYDVLKMHVEGVLMYEFYDNGIHIEEFVFGGVSYGAGELV